MRRQRAMAAEEARRAFPARRWRHAVAAGTVVLAGLAACAGSGDDATPTDRTDGTATAAVPLVDAASSMEPAAVWQFFADLTQVPRPSHQEAEATAFVADVGRELGLETIVDDVGNVVIRKPATAGMEGRSGVVLQAHLDMVAQQEEDVDIDLTVDPVAAVVEDGWVHAQGTTLGADDGIGVALILAVLAADDVAHGPLEALFTVNEEDGMTGINALAPDVLTGRSYINVDNEIEGQFLISSAGGVTVTAAATYDQVPAPEGSTGFRVGVDGLLGGHSGVDIDKGRGSAHQIMARLLVGAPDELDVRLASLAGGDRANAIPRAAEAVVAVPTERADDFTSYVAAVGSTVSDELGASDPDVEVTTEPVDVPSLVMAPADQDALLGAVDAVPQGVYRMSEDVPGLVETSGNLGVLAIDDGEFAAAALARSALDPERDAEAQRFAEAFEAAGATVEMTDAYAAWPPNPDSPLLATMERVYEETFGRAPEVTAIHAGLETSVAGATYPGLDMISIGPTLVDVHSPGERLEVASVGKVYDLLLAALGEIP